MNDQSAGVLGLIIVLGLVLFVGFWFGWGTVLWTLVAGVVALLGFGVLARLLK